MLFYAQLIAKFYKSKAGSQHNAYTVMSFSKLTLKPILIAEKVYYTVTEFLEQLF